MDPLRVRKPPRGLDRDERRDWLEEEAQRIADLQDQIRAGGFRAVKASAPPKGLGRAGRRAWREADRDNRSRRMQAESASSESDRYVGALVLMVVLAIVVTWRVLAAGSAPDAAQPSGSAPPPVTYQAAPTGTPAPAATAAAPAGPQAALLVWFTAVCPSAPDDPQSARLARSLPLMTPAAAAAVNPDPTPPGAVWTCSNITATTGPATTDQAVVYYTADITDARGTRTLSEARTIQLQGGVWLIGPLAGAAG